MIPLMIRSYAKCRLFLLMLLLITGSCTEDFLDVENKNQVALNSFYRNKDDVWMAVNTAYNPLAFGGMFGVNYFLLINSFDDRILFETSLLDDFNISSSSGTVSLMYQALYVGVWRCSHIIYNLRTRNIPDLDDNTRNNYIAQLKTLRAMYYFYLVVLFKQPYFYDDTNLPVDYLAGYGNSDASLFWNRIKEDLLWSVNWLPQKWPSVDLGRVTRGSALALLGKAMLYKHYHYYMQNGQGGSAGDITDLRTGKQALSDLISSGTHNLIQPKEPFTFKDYVYSYLCNFSYIPLSAGNNVYPAENNDESVWEIQYSDERIAQGWLPGWQWSGSLNGQYFSPHESSYRNHEIHPNLFLQYDTIGTPPGFDRDPRAYATCYLDGDTMEFRPDKAYFKPYRSGINNKKIAQGRGFIYSGQPTVGFGLKKYYFPVYNEKDAPKNDPVNIRIIRYSDVLLMFAEYTMLLNEDQSDGLYWLNEVRARAGMAPAPALTASVIMHERDVELATEGHRFLDLVRWSFDPQWKIVWPSVFGNNAFVKGKNEYLPIPIVEINKNKGLLKQNPGW